MAEARRVPSGSTLPVGHRVPALALTLYAGECLC